MKRFVAVLFLASGVAVMSAAWATGQDAPVKGRLTLAAHEVDMKADHLYFIKIVGSGFLPRVTMMPAKLPNSSHDFSNPGVFISHYVAGNNEKNTIIVLPESYDLKGQGPIVFGTAFAPRHNGINIFVQYCASPDVMSL